MLFVNNRFSIFIFPDGRHFKAVYGKDLLEFLINSSDAVLAELEQTPDERLSLHQNKAATLQGQIDLLKSHQLTQDLRLNYTTARQAEESDGRINERFLCF